MCLNKHNEKALDNLKKGATQFMTDEDKALCVELLKSKPRRLRILYVGPLQGICTPTPKQFAGMIRKGLLKLKFIHTKQTITKDNPIPEDDNWLDVTFEPFNKRHVLLDGQIDLMFGSWINRKGFILWQHCALLYLKCT